MIFYLAGAEGEMFYFPARKMDFKHFLFSFYTLRQEKHKGLIENRYSGEKFFLDSGGYSARMQGVQISIQNYAKFINENKQYLAVAANLDTNDIEETLANQNYLINNCPSVKILPVYHLSDWITTKYRDLLDKYIKDFDYIALGGVAGLVGAGLNIKKRFLSYCFAKTKQNIKVHGFGMTGNAFVLNFPFYSVDSTSWQSGSRYGQLCGYDGRSYNYRNKKVLLDPKYTMDLVDVDYKKLNIIGLKTLKKRIDYVNRVWERRGIVWK